MVLKQVMVNKYYLAIDIGASSGRHIVGWLEDNEIKTDEVYRFKNGTKTQNGHLVWDIKNLFDNVINGIRDALKKYDERLPQGFALFADGERYAGEPVLLTEFGGQSVAGERRSVLKTA